MWRLTCFELRKIWSRRSFLLSVCALMILNLFFLWHNHYMPWADRYGSGKMPALSAYKRFQSDIAGMSEREKQEYIGSLMRNIYESGEYVRYTDSPELERIFIRELYEEESKVAAYDAYLRSVQETKNSLLEISVFGQRDGDTFSVRNLRKSAADYMGLTGEGIKWMPSKPVVSAMESVWTDILLILLLFLFVGGLITEEKQKGLFYVTRSTRYGIRHNIIARLLALLIHCLVSAAVFFWSNYLFFGLTAGWGDVTAKLQSLAPYMESNLQVSILGYFFLSVFTKGLVLFGAGTILTAFCIFSENMALPYLAGLVLWSVGWALYQFMPAASKSSMAKHINLFAILRTENLYGTYLNLNLAGFPFSRMHLSWILIGIVILTGVGLSYLCFLKGSRLQLKRGKKRPAFPFHAHACLFRHESYKILVMNHGFLILLAFSILTGDSELARAYAPTAQEKYYQDMMLQLEGAHTEEKAEMIASEAARYKEAFEEIEKTDAAVASGEISSETGDAMKIKWYSITAFYPAFQRVEQQYRSVRENGGNYIYDTGYLYLFGVMGDGVLYDFLLLTIGIILAFGNGISMEYDFMEYNSMKSYSMKNRNGIWGLLCATAKGKRGILTRKMAVCIVAAGLFSAVPYICRWIRVSGVFPIRGLFFAAQSIPFYQGMPSWVPVVGLMVWKLLLQIVSGLLITMGVLVISGWRKNDTQALFFGLLIFCAPVVLTVLGFGAAQWLSVYPLYACTFR